MKKKADLKWMYGVTTVPKRKGDLLKQTLRSLGQAGFDAPRLFVDGLQSPDSYDEFGLKVTARHPNVLTAGSWMLALWELYARDPFADRYAIFQDDVVTYKNLRGYLERCGYPKQGYLNLCTYPQNQDLANGRQGWYASNQMGRGAQALVFSRDAVIALLSDRHLPMRFQRSAKSYRSIDGTVSRTMRNQGFREFVHNPSLVFHTGATSSMQKGPQPLVRSFLREEFDALGLPGTFHAAEVTGLESGHGCLVAGAGGFIGGYLVRRLLDQGYRVTAVDLKPLKDWWQIHHVATNWPDYDLRSGSNCLTACKNQDHVFNLAADMGGIGFIEGNKADCMVSVLINTNLLRASVAHGIQRYFFASSACVYHADRQKTAEETALKEQDAYHNGGAMPEDGYGWEKLFSERICRHFREDYGLETRVARFHNIYGPHGSWCDGREKAPAAMCRKVAEAKLHHTNKIEVWGDGTITRSFCWIDDCVDGILRLTGSDHPSPMNIGSSELVTVNQLVDVVEQAAETKVARVYDQDKPLGVAGRNSDNTRIKKLLGWEPSTPLAEGITKTYHWIENRVRSTM